MQSSLSAGFSLISRHSSTVTFTNRIGSRLLQGGFSKGIHSTAGLNMPITVGAKIPDVDLFEGTPGGKVNLSEFCKGRKVILFGLPGAFTPNCSKTHLPGFVEMHDQIKAKGIDEVACISVNDPFVMSAWGDSNNAGGKVRMLADTVGEFTKAADMEIDLSKVLGTVRCKRFSMLVDDGVVKVVETEPDGTGTTCSVASTFMKNL